MTSIHPSIAGSRIAKLLAEFIETVECKMCPNCPKCGGEANHARTTGKGNAVCNKCGHVFTDENYGKMGEGIDPVVMLSKMVIHSRFHPDDEYDLKPIRLMRQFFDANPTHRLAKAADWSNDMVWMDQDDPPVDPNEVTPEKIPLPDEPIEVPITPEPVKLQKQPEPQKKTTHTTYKWDDDGRIVQKTVEEVLG